MQLKKCSIALLVSGFVALVSGCGGGGGSSDSPADTTAPVLALVTPVTTLTNDNTPSYTFSSSEAGTITYSGGCTSATTSAVIGNNSVTLAMLADGTYGSCTVRVTDTVGNASSVLNITAFTVDATSPTLAQVTQIATPTNDATPNYTFSSSEAGLITYSGACSSVTQNATSGNNTISFNTLSDGVYSNCTIRVTDSIGNLSASLTISSFTVDATAPALVQVAAVTSPTNDTTPNYTFSTTEAGTIAYSGSCSSATTTATSGNNSITFNTLSDGTYSNCTLTLTDDASNTSLVLAIPAFTIDNTAPVVAQVTAVPTPTNDTTPSYTFSSTEHGSIRFDGGCASATNTAEVGSNVITLTLSFGLYQRCTLIVTDAAGNDSSALAITTFFIGNSLNDTGIILCGDYAYDDTNTGYIGSDTHNNSIHCANDSSPSSTATQEGFEIADGFDSVPAGQDAHFGRDDNPDTNDDSDGYKGFSFIKIGANGQPLAIQDGTWSDDGSEELGTIWSCVQDNVTGLIWEVKTNDGLLRDRDWTYTWYSNIGSNNGGDHGIGDTGLGTTTGYETYSGTHVGSDNCSNAFRCDTEKFSVDVNAVALCGFNDWRMPSSDELKSLLHLGRTSPAIDTSYFPNTMSDTAYWSSSPAADSRNFAWYVYFDYGFVHRNVKHDQYGHVRLVRSGQ